MPETSGHHQQLIVQTGHSSQVVDMAVSADGNFVATADYQGAIWLWDATSGRAIRKLDLSHQQLQKILIKAITFNPAKHELLIVSDAGTFTWSLLDEPAKLIQGRGWAGWGDKAIYLPDGNNYVSLSLSKGQDLAVFNNTQGMSKPKGIKLSEELDCQFFSPMEFSQDGKSVACVREDGVMPLVNLATGQISATFSGLDDEITGLAFGNNGTFLASVTNSTIMITNIDSGELIGTFKTKLKSIFSVSVHPHQPFIVAAGSDQEIALIDLAEHNPVVKHIQWKQKQSISSVRDLSFSSDGNILFARCIHDSSFVRAIPLDSSGKPVSFQAHGFYGKGVLRFGKDNQSLIIGRPGAFTIWALSGRGDITHIQSDYTNLSQVVADRQFVLTSEVTDDKQTIYSWSPERGKGKLFSTNIWRPHPVTGDFINNTYDKIGYSPNLEFLHLIGNQKQIIYSHKESKVIFETFEKIPVMNFGSYAYSPDSLQITYETVKQEIVAYDIQENKELWRTKLGFDPESLHYSSDGLTVFANGVLGYTFLDAKTGLVQQARNDALYSKKATTFTPVLDGHCINYIIASTWTGNSNLFDISKAQFVHRSGSGNSSVIYAIEDANGEIISANKSGSITIIQPGVENNDRLIKLGLSPLQFALSSDQKLLAILNTDGSIVMLNMETGKQIARLVEFLDEKWAVVANDGRYDAKDPGETPGLSWVMADEPFTPRPIEIFFKEYYEPRLLQRLLTGEKFPKINPPTDICRIQPKIKITKVEDNTGVGNDISVTVEVESGSGFREPKGSASTKNIGVFDVKLFRNGQMIGMIPKDGGQVITDPDTGKATLVFKAIKIASSAQKKPVKFTAYAFNSDGIKSETARFIYTPSSIPPKRKRRAYIISIGVNKHETPAWNLKYAANDAAAVNQYVSESLMAQHTFEEVVAVQLISSQGSENNNGATKDKIGSILQILAGKAKDYVGTGTIDGADQLKQVGPDDVVIISFSGHGYAEENGTFHLFPSDIGSNSSRVLSKAVLEQTIGSDDLYHWLRDVDAGEMILIIDACNSAASVEGKGFKPGPMGSRGLGQLAYDKGMRILTASQAEAVALESDQIGHGALTYALIKEGIEGQLADREPYDKNITVSEWLRYGMERVPILYNEILSGEVKNLSKGFTIFIQEEIEPRKVSVQQPGLFDFNKTGVDTVISVE